jgi:hypothetical protein
MTRLLTFRALFYLADGALLTFEKSPELYLQRLLEPSVSVKHHLLVGSFHESSDFCRLVLNSPTRGATKAIEFQNAIVDSSPYVYDDCEFPSVLRLGGVKKTIVVTSTGRAND